MKPWILFFGRIVISFVGAKNNTYTNKNLGQKTEFYTNKT